ncbi:hypothetical protein QQ44_16070 [Mycolicibacterium setense]|uniref:Apea-like HEPN domain-containing protein n=1 Tax=Mycolicibacterium setense TaxID=431269 RepID=A0ABR4YRR8_9MYCO|nr:hypothetical protein QQ44_16070 [Mycolicibacterium setense]
MVWAVKTNIRFEATVDLAAVRPIELFVESDLPPVIEHLPQALNRQQNLAYGLAHIALSTINTDVQFILWVSAIEALIPDELPIDNEDVVAYLDELTEQVKASGKFNTKVRKKVSNVLKQGGRVSITDFGAKLAATLDSQYDGKSAEEFFRENYPVRSALVHGNSDVERRPTRVEIQRRLPHLQRFVLDLLTVVTSPAC